MRGVTRRLHALQVLAALVATAGCVEQGPGALQGQGEPAQLLHQHVLGGTDPGFGEVTYFAVSEDGALAVMDRIGVALHVFDSAGGVMWSAAERGQGPGEMVAGGPVTITRKHVAVVDSGRGVITVRDREGNVVREIAWPARSVGLSGRGDTLYLKVAGRGSGGFDGSFRVIPFLPVAGVFLDPVLEVEAGLDHDGVPLGCLSCSLRPHPAGGFVLKPPERSYRVAWVEGGGAVTEIWDRPDRRVVPFTDEEWVRWRRRRHEHGNLIVRSTGAPVPDIPFSADLLPPPGTKPPLESTGSIGVDAEGRVWTLPAVPFGNRSELDQFAKGGELLETVRVTESLTAIEVAGQWMAGLVLDDLDRPTIHVYRILPKDRVGPD